MTADQVAARAGVSRSAVSRSFSKTASVAPDTRDKVLRAAAELGYRPNGVASTLASGKSNIVAVLTNSKPDILRSELLHLLNVALQEEGLVPYVISIGTTYAGAQSLTDLIQMPIATAIVTADSVTCQQISPYCLEAPPIMLNGRIEPGEVADRVVTDDAVGIRQMIRHLVAKGRKTLWLITARRSSSAYDTRNSALLEAMVGTHVTLMDTEEGDFTYEGGKRAFAALQERGPLPDCVFCANDAMAMGAMDVARFQNGIDVPGTLEVIGFDNIPQARWPTYNLPTIEQSPEALVGGIRSILRQRAGKAPKDKPIVVTLPTRFVESTPPENRG
ncbi:LacI family DNA-binding transcriptional regulator [Halovulum sp. GXIMD14794]